MDEQPTLAEIGRKLDSLDSKLSKILDDHEIRLRKVERWVYSVPPTLLLAMASIIAAIFKA